MSPTTARRDRVIGWTRPAVREMKPYYKAPVEGDPLRLDQNTNLYGPNPVLHDVDPTTLDVTLYPSRDADDLLAALSDWHGIDADRFLVGNGSDEVLDIITKTFTQPGQALTTPWPSYSLYPFYSKLQDLKLRQVPLRGGFRLDVDAVLAEPSAVTILATPNNPTGRRIRLDDIERIAAETDGIVVVDEAYIEYAGLEHSLLRRVDDFDNLVVMRTFSKAYGLAGLRIGYLAGNADLMERLRVVKPPFNLNAYAEQVAIAALDAQEWVDDVVRSTMAERERMAAKLKSAGLRPHPSDANFILCDTDDDPAALSAALRERGILARTFPGAAGLQHCIRFTVGRPEHTDALVAALDEVVA